jgi:WD40 repeat protein
LGCRTGIRACGTWPPARKLATGHVSKEKGGGFGTYAVAFTPDGKRLLTAGRDNVTKLWDLESGQLLRTFDRHYTWVEVLAVSRDGKVFASAGQDGLIRLWDVATGADACPQPGHKYAVTRAALTPDGRTAVTGGWDATLRWWDVGTGAEQRVVNVPDGITGLALSPDGRTVLATTNDGKLRTWDTASGRETAPVDVPGGGRHRASVLFTPDGRHLIAAAGPQLTIYDWPGLKPVRTIELPKPAKQPGENACQTTSISPDGRWLVTVAMRYWFREADGLRFGYAADGVVDVWEFATGKRVRRLAEGQPTTFSSGTFTADGRLVLVGGRGVIPAQDGRAEEEFNGEMNLLDPIAGRRVRGFEVPPPPSGIIHRYSGAATLSPDGRTFYAAYNTGEIIGFEVATGKPRRTLAGHRNYIGGLAFTADGRRMVSGGHDGTALVWDVTLAGATTRREPLTEADAARLWVLVTDTDSRAAFDAMADLAAAPDHTVALIRRYLKPAPAGPTAADIDRIFKDLASDSFATREKASKELAGYGESAVPAVRKALEAAPDLELELRKRVDVFLGRFDRADLTPDRLRQLRAVELLEGIGTPAAKDLLKELAAGAPAVPLTIDAAAALKRMGPR